MFQIITAGAQKKRILWPFKGENTLQKHLPKGVLEICVWQLLLKLFRNFKLFKKLK